jgi:uncharacterized OsmC-like protein
MDVRIKWVDGMMFLGESESGHAVVMDGPPEIGKDASRKHPALSLSRTKNLHFA